MKRPLQDFSFKKSFYERPNQKWICGRACLGEACLAGPDAQGRCAATSECQPLRKGDRWQCTRPSALGGPCAEGPRPDGTCCRPVPKCTPVRSLRYWRGMTVLLVLAASLSALFLFLGSERGASVLLPGPLSFAHASATSKCSDCHAGVTGRPVAWLIQNTHLPSAHADSVGCQKCHNLGAFALQPHSLPQQTIQELTQAALARPNARHFSLMARLEKVAAGVPSGSSGLACADCHHEHQGQNNDLKRLSNAQCQSCHTLQFASFAQGHPSFTTYPFKRRSRIIFDHLSHLRQHFAEPAFAKAAPRSCLDCHQADAKGQTMLVKPFEEACGACHGEQVAGKGAVHAGIPFLSLPRLDDRALVGPNSIGEWPEDADQDLTPFMRLLLSADPELRSVLDRLKGVDLSNLPKDNGLIQAAQKLAWGIKGLLFDLQTQGQAALAERLANVLGRPLTLEERSGAASLLGAEALQGAFAASFPHLQQEVLAYRNQHQAAISEFVASGPAAGSGPGRKAPPETWVESGGWYSPPGSFTLFYHPAGHADRFLTTWMNLTVATTPITNPATTEIFNQLGSPKGVGLCAKCHSIDARPVNLVNWRAELPDPAEHGFNRFSHAAHLPLLDNRRCFSCHSLDTALDPASFAAMFERGKGDPSKFRSNFRVIDQRDCLDCHKRNLAGEDCLLCHNYHIGKFGTRPRNTEVSPVALLDHHFPSQPTPVWNEAPKTGSATVSVAQLGVSPLSSKN